MVLEGDQNRRWNEEGECRGQWTLDRWHWTVGGAETGVLNPVSMDSRLLSVVMVHLSGRTAAIGNTQRSSSAI